MARKLNCQIMRTKAGGQILAGTLPLDDYCDLFLEISERNLTNFVSHFIMA